MHCFWLSFPCRYIDGVTSSWPHCVTIHTEYCLPRKLTGALGVQFLVYCLCGCLLISSHSQRPGYLYSSVLTEVRNDVTWPQSPCHTSYCRLPGRGQSLPSKQRYFYQAGYSKGLDIMSKSPGKNQDFSYGKARFLSM